MLLTLTMLPLLFALALCAAPAGRAKGIATAGTLAPVALFAYLAWVFPWGEGAADHFVWSVTWVEALGISLSFGADTVSMLLVGLTVLLGPICVVCSYTSVTERLKTYYGWLLVLQAAMTGVFLARDLVAFYVFFEFTLVPLYVLISLYGSTNRKTAATKFFLYTFTGSLITLAGLVYLAWHAAERNGSWSFDFATLRAAAVGAGGLSASEQALVFGAMMLGFGVKVPLFPVHTWLPLAHTEAPTAGSVVLAGVLLKLGTYGIFRFALGLTPAAAVEYAPLIGVLCLVGIVYAGLICWVQTDVKKLVAYSSVSHLGFCVLGLFALNGIGVTGSVLYMINHGLSTGALFLLVGMMYERYHTRSMKELGGLAGKMPVWSTFMVFFVMASVGLPGLNGFISEFMCLLGAFQGGSEWAGRGTAAGLPGPLGPWYAVVGGTGIIVTAIYLLYMVGRIVFGPLVEPGGHGAHGGGHGGAHGHGDAHGANGSGHGGLPVDLTAREIGVLAPLAVLCVVLGMYPTPVLRVLEEPVGRAVAEVWAGWADTEEGPARETVLGGFDVGGGAGAEGVAR